MIVVPSLENLAAQDGDVYTIDTALVAPDGAGRFNLSELLFIPPPDLRVR